MFHPGMMRSFESVMMAQRDEYARLYGAEPVRVDGHHHMHLCANILMGGLLPAGTVVRRSFSFFPGEKGLLNRAYRRVIDQILTRRHRTTDFFLIQPLFPPERLQGKCALARKYSVEIGPHPYKPDEYEFLMGNEFFSHTGGIPIASRFALIAAGRKGIA